MSYSQGQDFILPGNTSREPPDPWKRFGAIPPVPGPWKRFDALP